MFRRKSNLFSALSEHENVPIGVILDLLQESPVPGAVFRSEASHSDEFPDSPVLSVHAGAAIRAGRISLATPSLDLSGLLVLYINPCGRVRVDPVDFREHTGRRPFLVRIEFRREGMMRQSGKYRQ